MQVNPALGIVLAGRSRHASIHLLTVRLLTARRELARTSGISAGLVDLWLVARLSLDRRLSGQVAGDTQVRVYDVVIHNRAVTCIKIYSIILGVSVVSRLATHCFLQNRLSLCLWRDSRLGRATMRDGYNRNRACSILRVGTLSSEHARRCERFFINTVSCMRAGPGARRAGLTLDSQVCCPHPPE
jgi:hypothetical protein